MCEWMNIQLGNYTLGLVLNFLQPYSRECLMARPEFLMATFGQKVWLLCEQMQHFILEEWISPSVSKVKKNQFSYVSYETFWWAILEWPRAVGRGRGRWCLNVKCAQHKVHSQRYVCLVFSLAFPVTSVKLHSQQLEKRIMYRIYAKPNNQIIQIKRDTKPNEMMSAIFTTR